ncbi:MAG: porin family protein [Bradyrhizobium sp.]|nr:porin family protein [Bradyrhizobium sp.]
MKKFWVGTAGLALLASAGSASAADMAVKAPPPAPLPVIYNWSGFYIGANGGGGWSDKCWDVTNFRTPIAAFREGCHDASGGVVGGQIGYRWQSASWVFGLEAQGDWADLTASNVSAFIPAWTNNSKVEGLGLFTGQVGYAWNNFLWYVKGGAAVTSDKYRGTVTTTGILFDSASETRWGGVIGTGVEFGFAPNWSLALEYDHLFMGNHDITFTSAGVLAGIPAGAVFRTESIRQDVDMVTARINYHFNWGGPPVTARY